VIAGNETRDFLYLKKMLNEENKEDTAAHKSNGSTHKEEALAISNTAEPPAANHGCFGLADPKLRPFVIISITYLLFTVTDGAIRMIVLLHAYNKSFSALEVAIMFTLYELAGVFTNLAAGLMGARWGIRFCSVLGLSLQILSYGLLFGWQDDWTKQQAIVYVTIAQMFAGIAKDLTKLGGKTVTKLVTPEGRDTRLFHIVSLLTGWKNSLKGVGYFLGSALLEISYEAALWTMIVLILIALPFAVFGLSKDLGTAKKKNASWREIFVLDNWNLNVLSFARMFLFASRDFWFEVPVRNVTTFS
jgi:MFS family permease